jgi:hypothetical protein
VQRNILKDDSEASRERTREIVNLVAMPGSHKELK